MSRRRRGHHECAGAQTGASGSPHDEAAADADEVWHLLERRPGHIRRLIERRGADVRSRARALDSGKPSNRQFPEPVNAKALTRYETLLGDLRPTWAVECHGITLSDEDHAAMAAGIWDRAFHATESAPLSVAGCGSPREGTPLLLLLDNVPYDWLEGRGSR
jgi:hypothetical protein